MRCHIRSCLLLGVVATVSGCTTFVPVSPRASLNEPEVEVHFATPRRLDARNAAGESVVRHSVTAVAGRTLEVRGDTVVLRISRWVGLGFWNRETQPLVTTLVASDACTDLGTRRYSRGRTTAAILGPPVIAWIVLYIACNSGRYPCLH